MSELTWYTKFVASEKPPTSPGPNVTPGDSINKLLIKGVLIDTTENKNRWCIEEEDFTMIATDFVGKQIRTDHAEKVSQVLGVVTGTEVDEPHSEAKAEWDPATEFPHIHFSAEIASNDANIMIPVKQGYVNAVSPAIDARQLLCSSCRKPMYDKNIKTCKCSQGGVLLKNISARELSIVCSPAYDKTFIKVYGFAAAVDQSSLSEEKILAIVEDEILRRGL